MGITIKKGTSLTVLAPYLPYKLEMAWVEAPYDMLGKGYYLRSLSDFDGHEVAISHRATPESFDCYSYENVLPVLRSFADLCKPLADGTVPAVEAARFIVADDVFLRNGDAFLEDEQEDEDTDTVYPPDAIYISAKDADTGERVSITLYKDWSCDQITYDPAGLIDYLRSQHFAVGLEPHQYIRKAAAPATPATRGEVAA